MPKLTNRRKAKTSKPSAKGPAKPSTKRKATACTLNKAATEGQQPRAAEDHLDEMVRQTEEYGENIPPFHEIRQELLVLLEYMETPRPERESKRPDIHTVHMMRRASPMESPVPEKPIRGAVK